MWGSKELRSKSLNTVWKADASTLGLRGRFFALWFCRSSMFARSCLQKDKIGQDYQTKVTLGSSKWHFCVCGGPLLGCSLQKKSALGWRPWALLKILGGIGALSVRRFSNFQVQRNALIWQKQKQRKSRKNKHEEPTTGGSGQWVFDLSPKFWSFAANWKAKDCHSQSTQCLPQRSLTKRHGFTLT